MEPSPLRQPKNTVPQCFPRISLEKALQIPSESNYQMMPAVHLEALQALPRKPVMGWILGESSCADVANFSAAEASETCVDDATGQVDLPEPAQAIVRKTAHLKGWSVHYTTAWCWSWRPKQPQPRGRDVGLNKSVERMNPRK